MARNINRVTVTGNLTADPELRHTGSGTAVCSLRIAVNDSYKDQSGQWVEKPNYFNVTVWGAQGESCKNYLSRGRPVAIDGRLSWREWEAKDGSGMRQSVEIVADQVQFLGSRGDAPSGGGQQGGQYGGQGHANQPEQGGYSAPSNAPDTGDYDPPGGGGDDIPF